MSLLPGYQSDPRASDQGSGLRTIIFVAVVVASFTIVVGRLYALQILQGGEFRRQSLENFVQTKRLRHERGEIMDRHQRLLVTNRPSYDVVLTPAFLPNTRRNVRGLGRVVGLSDESIRSLAVAFRKSVQEAGPPILIRDGLEANEVTALRAEQRARDVPLESVPVIETPTGYAAYLDPDRFPSVTRVFRRLEQVIELSPAQAKRVREKERMTRGLARYREITILADAAGDVAERLNLEIELGDLPGVALREGHARDYRNGRLAAHVLGYVNELSPQELESRRDLGYRLGDQIGRRGVEQAFEDELRGVDGEEPVVVDSKGRTQSDTLGRNLAEAVGDRLTAQAGHRVILTIDIDIQRAAEESFPGRAGSVVVMEVQTGRLLALTSHPEFDPNLVSGSLEPDERRRLSAISKLRPWRFRAIQDHYAPGSTFKVVTALAALQARVANLTGKIHCGGAFRLGNTRFRCWKAGGHGSVDIYDSLMKSCDVFYYTVGAQMGLDAIAHMAERLGFGARTGIAIKGEAPGIIPTAAWYSKPGRGGYTQGAAVNASIGQGAVTVTPLQLAVAYATIANGGTIWTPQLASEVRTVEGQVLQRFEPLARARHSFSARDLATVKEGLHRVVHTRGGTAYRYRLPEVEVGGKTGTAQVAKLGVKREKAEDMAYRLRDHAWFAAVAPVNEPEIVVVVLNEHGGHGSSGAAPTAMAVIDVWHKKTYGKTALQIGVAGQESEQWARVD